GAPVSAAHVQNGRDRRTGAEVKARRIAESEVEKQGDRFVLSGHDDIAVDARAHKMSKSRGNVVNPDDIVAKHGADAFRLYEMFMGPLEQVKPWSTTGVEGTHRFLNRVWRLIADDEGRLRNTVVQREPTRDELAALHRTIAK